LRLFGGFSGSFTQTIFFLFPAPGFSRAVGVQPFAKLRHLLVVGAFKVFMNSQKHVIDRRPPIILNIFVITAL
jgi:hypothetical protein